MSGVVPVEDWAKGKDEYFALTGLKKPREKVVGFFATTHTGLSKRIKAITADYDTLPMKDKTAKKYLELKTAYEKDAADYVKLLNKLIDEESDKTFTQHVVTGTGVTAQTVKTNMYRGLKMLKAKLDNYKTIFDAQYKMRVNATSGMSKIEKFEDSFITDVKNGFKRYVAAEKTIKATPTVEVWNREMDAGDGVRVLTTSLGAYRSIEKHIANNMPGTPLTPQQTIMLNLTMHWITQLSPWANGAKKKLPANANVLVELKAATTVVKQCSAALAIPM